MNHELQQETIGILAGTLDSMRHHWLVRTTVDA